MLQISVTNRAYDHSAPKVVCPLPGCEFGVRQSRLDHHLMHGHSDKEDYDLPKIKLFCQAQFRAQGRGPLSLSELTEEVKKCSNDDELEHFFKRVARTAGIVLTRDNESALHLLPESFFM
jgi:hypothetical protein